MTDGQHPRCRWRRVMTPLGRLAVVVGLLGLAARTIGVGWQPAIVLATFSPFTTVVAFVGFVLLLVRRSRPGTAVGAAVVAWTVVVQAPLFVASAPGRGAPLTVLQANLMVGAADADALVAQVRHEDVDVLTVDELTPESAAGLAAAGLDTLLPYRFTTPLPGGAGTGIWSAHPLSNTVQHDEFSFELLTATVAVPGAVPVKLFAVHLLPPWPYDSSTWLAEVERLRALLDVAARSPGVVVASGDFNATLDHPQFRALLRHGFHDAAEQAGSGYAATYPTDRHLPPLLTLDHVVVRNAGVARARTVDLPGSDHRGLLVALRIPPVA